MCGVAGAWRERGLGNLDAVNRHLAAMAGMIAHRGPDGQGVWTDGFVGLSHTRLAVIDVSDEAAQPMTDGHGSLHITYNGEIFNYRELRSELSKTGYKFRTASDTEVILACYERWGIDMLDRLTGMFAFALWDAKARRLMLARDRMGQKPLYYCWHDGIFLFASEIKALLAWPGLPRVPNLEAIHQYLSLMYVPAPNSAFDGISALPPASVLVVEPSGKVEISKYWELPRRHSLKHRTVRELEEDLQYRLDTAVKSQMVSDVAVGAYLSGGVDSASIVASMAKTASGPIKTFTIGFDEPAFDERQYARMIAEKFSTEHHEEVIRPDVVDILPKLAWHCDEPFADSSAIPNFCLSQFARQHVTVALNGDGGDESFLGYPRYRGMAMGAIVDRLPGAFRHTLSAIGRTLPSENGNQRNMRYLKHFLNAANVSEAQRYQQWISVFSEDQQTSLYEGDFSDRPLSDIGIDLDGLLGGNAPAATRAAWADVHTYLPGDLLVKIDRTTMAHGLEARSPFLDHTLMEFAFSIPESAKLSLWRTKKILKSAMTSRLPAKLLNRRKSGFNVPIGRWLRHELYDMCNDVLLSEKARSRGLFRPDAVRTLIDDHTHGRRDNQHRLWALLMLELWFCMWIDPPIPAQRP